MKDLGARRNARSIRARRQDAAVRWLRVLSLTTLVATYCLIVLGSTVRVTNSGMGCLGWPLCSGQVGPIARFHPLMEQSHRYLASLVTILILSLAALAWRVGPTARHLKGPAAVSVGVIAVQIVLGAITVVTNNAPATVALHLAVGLVFLGIVAVAAVASFVRPEQSWSLLHEPGRLAWATTVALFFVFISGSLVVDGGAQSACRSWPACGGSRASGGLVALQLVHRSVVLIGGTLVVVYLMSLLRNGRLFDGRRALPLTGLALLVAQITVGAFDALLGAPAVLTDVHLALAATLWAVVVAVLALSARGTINRTVLVGSPEVEGTVMWLTGPRRRERGPQ
ncbi:MAG: COX15/CtaA family protein [Acidimicrobiales bacterium]